MNKKCSGSLKASTEGWYAEMIRVQFVLRFLGSLTLSRPLIALRFVNTTPECIPVCTYIHTNTVMSNNLLIPSYPIIPHIATDENSSKIHVDDLSIIQGQLAWCEPRITFRKFPIRDDANARPCHPAWCINFWARWWHIFFSNSYL